MRSLAESAYHLGEEKRAYTDKVEQFVKESLQEVWQKVAREETKSIVAEDLLQKYVRWRFSELFGTLWVDGVKGAFGPQGPHDYHPFDLRGDFETHKILVGIDRPYAAKFHWWVEDELGLGVLVEDIQTPIAYGPKQFAERVKLINEGWSKGDMLVQTAQATIVLVSEAKKLDFRPIE